MDDERPRERPGRPAGHERDSWIAAQPAFGGGDAPPRDADADPERGPLGAEEVGAGLSGALAGGPEETPADGRDTVGAPDIEATPGVAESIGAGEEGT